MRLFIAVYPPGEVADDLARVVARLHVSTAGVNTRLARRENWHITLAFLGETPDERVDDVAGALAEATRDIDPPSLRIGGGGRFGNILWAGVEGDLDPLARRVRRSLKSNHIPYDRKPLKPHVTIARPGDRLDRGLIAEDRAALGSYRGPAWTVESVELMRSTLGPHPTYHRIRFAPLI